MKHAYEQIPIDDESNEESNSVLIVGTERVGKKTLVKALQANQKEDSFVLQNGGALNKQQYINALQYSKHILLVFNKHNLESLEKLAEFMPQINQYAPEAILTLVETHDDVIGEMFGVKKDPEFEGISFFVTTEEEDIQKFLKNQHLEGVHCISVSATEGKNIQALWDHITTVTAQAKLDDSRHETESEYGEESRLISPHTESSLLDKIDRFTTEYNSASAQITHKLNQEHLGHINSLATILIAGVLSKNPEEFFARKTVERTLNEHLRALHYGSPLSCKAVSNLVFNTLQSITPKLPEQFPYVNYLLQGKENSSMFAKRSPGENADTLVKEIQKTAPYLKK
ncbi:MAG: hypothetical protein ACO1N3_01465 [Gammaproteobacteria bacterium]